MDTEFVEQLQEGCIWRQARGAATEVLGAEDAGGSSEKVLAELNSYNFFRGLYWQLWFVLQISYHDYTKYFTSMLLGT